MVRTPAPRPRRLLSVLCRGAGFDEEEAAQVFKEIDHDGSGEVSISEFEAWCAGCCVLRVSRLNPSRHLSQPARPLPAHRYDSGQSAYLRKMEAAERDSDADEP